MATDPVASTSKLATAVCSQVSSAARRSAGLQPGAQGGVAQQAGQAVGQPLLAVDEQAAVVGPDGVGVPGDVGGDRRRAAGGRLGHRHAPPLALGRRGHAPGRAVEVDQLVIADVSGHVHPGLSADRLDRGDDVRAHVALADDHQPQVPHPLASPGGGPDKHREPLDRRQAGHRNDQRRLRAGAAGGIAGIDARLDHAHTVLREAQVTGQLLLGGGRQRHHRHPPVERWSHTFLEQAPHLAQPVAQRHVPHRAVHVVQPHRMRAAPPERRNKRHAVPDLDQGVAGPVTPGDLGGRSPGEHPVT